MPLHKESFPGLRCQKFQQDFGAGKGVEGVDCREYKPAAAPRVKFVNPLVGCSWPRRSWASSVRRAPLKNGTSGSGSATDNLPRADRGQAARWAIPKRIAHCLAVRRFSLTVVPQIPRSLFLILSSIYIGIDSRTDAERS